MATTVLKEKKLSEKHQTVLRAIEVCGPVTNKELAGYANVNERNIRHIVQELRIFQREPIGYGDQGYFIAETDEEMVHTTNKLFTHGTSQIQLSDILKENVKIRMQKLAERGDEL